MTFPCITKTSSNRLYHMLRMYLGKKYFIEEMYMASGYNYVFRDLTKHSRVIATVHSYAVAFELVPRLMGIHHIMFNSDKIDLHIEWLYNQFTQQTLFGNSSQIEKVCQKSEVDQTE